ncbi:MAG: hypothetical protein AB8B84_11140 [Granulosicoccus sp.]
MQLRRFTAESTPAALDAVRMSLGEEAIILANRRHGDLVEIIATGQMDDASTLAEMSIDDINESLDAVSEAMVDAPDENTANELTSSSIDSETGKGASTNTADELLDDVVDIGELSQSIASDAMDARPLEPLSRVSEDDNTADESEMLVSNTEAIVEEPAIKSSIDSDAIAPSHSTEQLQSLFSAMDAQNAMIEDQFKALKVNLWGSSSPCRSQHLQHLLSLGLGAEIAIRLVERAEPDMPLDAAIRQSYALLKSTLPVASDKTLSVPGVTIMSGAPGSGKTTALVKLATEHVKKEGNQSIVIICADTRRIGAFEELQSYGRLLGVPTVHAHDMHEIDSLVDAFKHKKLVLVDHSLPDDADAIELPECLTHPRDKDSVRHLFALPATTQSSIVEELIAKHCKNRNINCVLTHLDSNARLGELFNSIIRHDIPIAYWSDSSSVQKPLQRADASVLVATAVAMSRRIDRTPDDDWLQRLIQPSSSSFSENNLLSGSTALEES